jgi:hypothetical protein
MTPSYAVLTFAVIVTVTGLTGLGFMYRSLRRSEPQREVPKL